jgi:hypothetical protein
LPAVASARTVELNGAPFWHDKVITLGGLGWGTAYGACPAGPIEIRSGVASRSDLEVVGTLPSTYVLPFSGGFSTDIRIRAWRRPGTGELVLTQTERDFSVRGGCGPPHETRLVREFPLQRPPPDAPCTHGTDCALPQPHLLVSHNSSGTLPAGTALAPPPPVCPPRGCERKVPGEAFAPGAEAWLFGRGFPGTLYTGNAGCTGEQRNAVTFSLIDSTGSGFDLGDGGPEEWRLNDDGSFSDPVRVVLPTTGLASGDAVLTGVRKDYGGDPVCGQAAAVGLTISRTRPLITLDALVTAGSPSTIRGSGWKTNDCDSRVTLIETRGKIDRVLGRVEPGELGAFTSTQEIKPLKGKGAIRITASQDSGLELADERARPEKARCIKSPKVTDTFDSRPAKVLAPPPPPPPPPPPTVDAAFTDPKNLHVTGSAWDPTACAGGVPPVAITDPQSSGTLNLGSAVPNSAGDIAADLDPQKAKVGDMIVATQTHCDGSTASASTTAR